METCLGCFLLAGSMEFLSPGNRFRGLHLAGALIHAALFWAGVLLIVVKLELPKQAATKDRAVGIRIARVVATQATASGFRATLDIRYLLAAGKAFTRSERILAYFPKSEAPPEESGICFTALPERIENKSAAGGFDYAGYAESRGIFRRVFLRAGTYRVLGESPETSLPGLCRRWQRVVAGTIRRYVPGPGESGLLEALLIGYAGEVDRGLVRAYANTGLAHIIAISGLHLALLFAMVQALLAGLGNTVRGQWAKAAVMLPLVWLFAGVAGAGPSILRSAAMLTLPLTGRLAGRKVRGLNALAGSAIVLLIAEPLWLWDLGFQLSYLAVASLMLFCAPITAWMNPRNKGLRWLWRSASVSLAAQILTTPLCLLYFGRFPPYFLVSNLVAVPLSSAALTGGVFVFALSGFPAAASAAGVATGWLVRGLNGFVTYMDGLPFASIAGAGISSAQCVLLYVFTALMWAWLARKRALYGLAALAVLLLFFTIRTG